ncbi:MAG TPA: TetR family transcriptional regulator [Pseudolysinimonas sp.]|nr:TetR family transcriptional regulator [Pseudolysinimonas sp.]
MSPKVNYGDGRGLVVRAAIDLVAAEGLQRVTYRGLAAKAGVTHGVVQHHFPSIEAVLLEALELGVDSTLQHTPTDADLTPSAFTDWVTHLARFDPAFHEFQFQMMLESRRRPAYRAPLRRLYEWYWSAFAGYLESMGIEATDERVRIIFAAIDGLVFHVITVLADDAEGTRAAMEGFQRMLEEIQTDE